MNSQIVNFNQIPTINCPSGNMTICGTYNPPITGGPYNVVFSVEFLGNSTFVSGGNQYVTTLTANTFCLTIPVSILSSSPTGNYEVLIEGTFTQINSPFSTFHASDNSINDNIALNSGVDVFYSTSCPIIANDDELAFNQCIGGSISVLNNDVFFGNPATLSNVTLSQITTSPIVNFNLSTGVASVPAGTNPGTYNISYQICNPVNPAQCDQAIVSFMVIPQPIVTANNTFAVSACSTTTTTSVLTNDTLCGNPLGSLAVDVSFVGTIPITGATINNTGIISIPSGTPIGSYTFTYKVCHASFPLICSNSSTVIITVSNPPIIANNDNFTSAIINTLAGGITSSVLTNDLVNGAIATSSNVVVAILYSSPAIIGLSISPTGEINVPPGQANGNYTIFYSITQIGCSSNIGNGSALITVGETIFTPPIVAGIRANKVVENVDTQSDNKIIINGYFNKYNNISQYGIARLNTNLTLDTTSGFNSSGALPSTSSVPLASSNHAEDMIIIKNTGLNLDKILLVGSFTGHSDSYANGVGIARLMPNGNIDTSFNNEVLASGVIRGASGINDQIRTIFVYPNSAPFGNAGKMLIGGMFSNYNGQPAFKMARLNVNGSLDISFSNNINTIIIPGISATNGFSSSPQAIAIQSDGKIIVGGFFLWFNGYFKSKILRLNNDGTIDTTFNSNYSGINPNITGSQIQKIIIQPDNKIIIGGFFTKYNNVSRNNIARLMPNGDLDTSFDTGSGFFPIYIAGNPVSTEPAGFVRSMVYDIDSSSDSHYLYVSGDFTKFNNATCDEVIRLHCNHPTQTGKKDGGFGLISGGPNGYVWSMKKQGSKLLLAGDFTTYAGLSSLNVTRILPSSASIQNRGNTIYYVSESDIDLSTNEEIVIYPNPTTGILNFSTSIFEKNNYNIEVFNLLGQKIFERENINTEINSLDFSHLVKGSYFISFEQNEKRITKTIIIR